MKKSFFGTDGIRGTVGTDPITARFILELGHALGTVLKQKTPQPQVLIGKDTRLSGYMLESALESGLISAGVDVVLLGPVPTPAVAYLVRAQRADLGIVISASHNPYHDNGLKFFSAAGTKLPDSWEQDIENALAQTPSWATAKQLGRAKRLDDASGRYIEFCKSTFDKNLNLKGLKLVVDAAHGAAYQIAPAVFHELGAEVIKIGCSPDGVNINHEVGATNPKALQQAVLEHQADFGIALDGDADRLQMVNKQGRLFNGDELLYILTLDRLTLGEQVPGVVGTLMTNMAIEQALKELKVPLTRTQVGDRYVLEQLEKNAWLLGGESSGHLLVLDKHSTGDAIISALQVLQHCVRAQKSLEDVLHGISLYPQTMLNVPIAKSSGWEQNPSFINAKAEVEAQLGTLGRVLIRPSGTEPVVRVMVEAQDKKQCDALAERLKDSLTA